MRTNYGVLFMSFKFDLCFKIVVTMLCAKWCYIDGQAQDCSNSIANAMELLQSYAKPSYDENQKYHNK